MAAIELVGVTKAWESTLAVDEATRVPRDLKSPSSDRDWSGSLIRRLSVISSFS